MVAPTRLFHYEFNLKLKYLLQKFYNWTNLKFRKVISSVYNSSLPDPLYIIPHGKV